MLKSVRSLDELRRQGDAATPLNAAVKPLDLLRDLPAPPFGDDCAPPALLRMATAFSAATGFDRNGVLLAGIVSAAAMVDDRARLAVRPASEWFESARLWGLMIGGPSSGKSPTIRAASGPVKDKHLDLYHRWREENPDSDGSDRPALFTSDATIEKISDILRSNQRGILMLTEEFASWLGSIDSYRDGAGAKSRGEWLQLYDGGPHQIDRVKRGSFLVPNWSCSVLAAATPAGLRTHLKQLPDDGLIHRFIPVILQRAGDESPASAKASLEAWSRDLWRVFDQTSSSTFQARYRLSVSAQMAFDAERVEIRETVDALEDFSPALASHLGKHPGMLARVALVFHALENRQGDSIEPDTMQQAIAFMRTARRHAAVMFLGILGQAAPLDLVRAVGRSVLASRLESVGRNDLLQCCKAWRNAVERDQRQAMTMLEDACWLIPDDDSRSYGGWNASRWFVNPRVQAAYGDIGEQHRVRREQIRRSILGAIDD